MDVLNQGINGSQLDGCLSLPGSGVITDTDDEIMPGEYLPALDVTGQSGEDIYQPELTELGDLHD